MSETQGTVVHVVDDDESMRSSLSRLLAHSGYEVKCYASAGHYLVAEPDVRPGCILLDLEMPGPSGLELQQALLRQRGRMPIVFMSAYTDVDSTVRAIKGGAVDFLVKPLNASTLIAALESAFASVAGQSGPDHEEQTEALNERELIVLRGILAGRLNKQLAADLKLSERTIKSCRANVMRKLGAQSLTDLVRLAAPYTNG